MCGCVCMSADGSWRGGVDAGVKRTAQVWELRLIDICKKILFNFCKMFENVKFLETLHLKLAKANPCAKSAKSKKNSLSFSPKALFHNFLKNPLQKFSYQRTILRF